MLRQAPTKRSWFVALIVAVLGVLAVGVRPASAHASFSGSDPADGSSLAAAPATVRLRFTEGVLLEAVDLRLIDAATGESRVLTAAFGATHTEVSVAMPPLGTGGYVLQFAVVDAADLHRTSGSVSFGVGVAPPPTQASRELGSPVAISIARFVADVAVIGAIGAIGALLVGANDASEGEAPTDRPSRRIDAVARRVTTAALAVVVVDGFIVVDQARAVGFGRVRWTSLILSSDAGRATVLAAQGSIALLAIPAARRCRPSVVERWLLGVAALLLAMSSGWGGHGALSNVLLGWLLRSAHVGSVGMWLGLVLVTWWVATGDAERGNAAQRWRAVSTLAGVGIATTAASGLLLAPRVAVNVTALLTSVSGRAVLVKAGTLVALGVVGWRHRRALRSGSTPRSGLLRADAVGLAVAVAAAVTIAGSPPARGERYAAPPAPVSLTGTAQAKDLTLTATLGPGFPGPNLLRIGVLNTRRPAPGAIDSVHVRLTDATGAVVVDSDAVPQSGAIQIGGVIVPAAGTYRLTLGVVRPQASVPPATLEWSVPSKPVPRVAEVVSRRPLAGPAEVLAVVALFGGLGVVVLDTRRRLRVVR